MALPHPQGLSRRRGLYDPEQERDACGVAFVADLHGRRSHDVVAKGLSALIRLDHRGARGAEYNTGDGAGIMIQVPDAFYRSVADFELPPRRLATPPAWSSCPTTQQGRPREPSRSSRSTPWSRAARCSAGGTCRSSRTVSAPPPTRPGPRSGRSSWPRTGSPTRRPARPAPRSAASTWTGWRSASASRPSGRRRSGASARTSRRCPRAPSRTRACSRPDQLPAFFPDLTDPRTDSAIALVHSRFSTNTFPSWPLAHPYRFIAHNGEINTIRGNKNWMQAREALLRSNDPAGQHQAAVPDRHAGGVRLGRLRRGAGAAAPGRPQPAARGADDDPGGLGERPGDGPGTARLLPLPRQPDGAVGRPGQRGVHRRHDHRRGAGPQRAAPGPLVAHQRRPGGARLRGRRARPRPGHAWSPRAGCSRAGCSWWTPRPAGSCTTTRSRPGWPPPSRTTSGCTPG